MSSIYLDWAATAPPDSELQRNALSLSLVSYGNPSSAHSFGKEARALLEDARASILQATAISKGNFLFTGSGTEADQIPLLSLLRKARRAGHGGKPIHLVISSIEHAAIDSQVRQLEKMGFEVSWIDADARGFIDPQRVADRVRYDTALVAVMAVNNETGSIQDISAIGRLVREAAVRAGARDLWLHVDAVQALGKLPMRELTLQADSVAVSAHKIQGPKGIGGLWLGKPLEALALGGGQEQGIRAGTENVFGAIAFALAAQKAYSLIESRMELARILETRLIEGIARIPGALLVPHRTAKDSGYVPHIISVAFPGVGGETMVRALSDRGIAVSTGSACSSNIVRKGRRILKAMEIPEDIALCALRVSTGSNSTLSDIDTFLEHAEDLYRKLKT